jgi:hypothetical protein
VSQIDRHEGHLVVAAIRVLAHREGRAPTPEEVADLLDLPGAAVRLQLAVLQDLGAVRLVESAFATHVEVHDHTRLEELPEGRVDELSSDLADFDRRKQEEAERMERLFADGEHDRRRQEKHGAMDRELQDFHKRKPRNPFDD